MLFFTQFNMHVTSPPVSTDYTYEGNNPASPLMNINVEDAIPRYVIARSSKVKLTLMGNINWNSSSSCSTSEPINFQPILRYSLNDGETYTQHATPGVTVHNGGTDFVLPLVLTVTEGQVLRVQPAIRFQQLPTLPTNCVADFLALGSFELME